jgi:hypothetical protein
VVAAPIDAYGIGVRGLLKALKEAGPVVLLSPQNSLTAAYVNMTIDRNATFTGPPGRAYLLVDGELRLGQVAELQEFRRPCEPVRWGSQDHSTSVTKDRG